MEWDLFNVKLTKMMSQAIRSYDGLKEKWCPNIIVSLISYLWLDIDECEAKPCRNSALCLNQENKYRCICQGGFSGKNCDIGKISNLCF